jgi:DNA modification methylase
MPEWEVMTGDCLQVMKDLPDNVFHSMCCDPPAGIQFMNREWDGNHGSRDHWIDWMCERMEEARRVLRPGSYSLVWAIPRTSHWTATALEDAGFEVRDIFTHHFGSGMPKSQDVAQFIDYALGQPRRAKKQPRVLVNDEAKQWDGWGTTTKPGTEHWILARKPLAPKLNIAQNVLQWGTGALNIDASRLYRAPDDVPGWHESGAKGSDGYQGEETFRIRDMSAEEIKERCGDKGRWPPNLLLTHSEGCNEGPCVADCPVLILNQQSGHTKTKRIEKPSKATEGSTSYAGTFQTNRGARGYTDEGGAARFFPTFRYQSKPARAEREAGLDDLPFRMLHRVNPGGLEHEPRFAPIKVKNHHPTVKGIALMKYLLTLCTPPGGYVLDPFLGSGSTGCAAVQLDYGFYGCDLDNDFVDIARARIRYWQIRAKLHG